MRFKNYNVEAQCTTPVGDPERPAADPDRQLQRAAAGPGRLRARPWEYTLGELFSDAGYATAAFGKWHVGDIDGRLPTDQGFDEWFGIKNTSDEAGYSSYPLFASSGGAHAQDLGRRERLAGHPGGRLLPETRPLLDEQIAARTANFIARNAEAGAPFCTYVCFTQMHPPLLHHPDFTGASGGGVYSDTLAELDHRTGQVLDAIDQAGIADNTIVGLSSDNPAGQSTSMGGSNGPWRGHFGSGFEGGMRAPAMVCWPGRWTPARSPTRSSPRSTGCQRWRRWSGNPSGSPPTAHRRRGRLGVPAWPEPHDRTRSRHLLRLRRRGVVGQMANHEGRAPLQRKHQRPDHQAPVAAGVRPDRRPAEEWDLIEKRLDCAWVLGPVARHLGR